MSTGHHEASWRLPGSDPAAGTDVRHFQAMARTAERGTFDSVFFADSPALAADVRRRPAGALDPTVLLTAIAGATERIGLIATASTTYEEPYHLARRFASLDHVSGGRAGWNVVTTASEDAARNFGRTALPSHAERYARAGEALDVVRALWDSWDDDAVLADKGAGVWGDPDRVRPVEHRGAAFSVRGPLDVPRPPQGHPLLVQAGSSPDGKDLAARYADAVFTAQQTLEDAQAFADDLRRRAAGLGRDPWSVRVLPGLVPVLGATTAEAREREEELDRLIVPEHALRQLAALLRVAPDELSLDRELPAVLPDEESVEGMRSRYALVVSLARRERLTVRQLIGRLGGGRGHRTFSGTAEEVADTMLAWWRSGAADGFNVMPPALPSGLEEFVDQVVPVLRERGAFRSAYAGTTLREHYGLPRPADRRSRGARVPGQAVPAVAGVPA
ncbi:LLM class flavin-dependent oxidoreductase [Vallicoccus soli]|uniref:LLM class flavin-dependent oxidoreductase n=2 Tax=Vallicoccus soli TaxID=2339232 RepID=A0A3A3Z224_9ACTN|nr:LLM class flavin-dependent oxidoreductase [Vallicoccus soli]